MLLLLTEVLLYAVFIFIIPIAIVRDLPDDIKYLPLLIVLCCMSGYTGGLILEYIKG